MVLLFILAAALAFVAGFAVQRGGICAVKAVREVVEEGDGRRFLSLIECAAWALVGLLIAHWAGLMHAPSWPAQASLGLAILGGALFGAGALMNGACAFGTMGRFAAGETAFLALPFGFVLGVRGAGAFGMQASAPAHFVPGGGPLFYALLASLAGFALYRFWSAWRAAPGLAHMLAHLRAPRWPAALAMAVTAFANVGLLLLVISWPYTSVLTDFALHRAGADIAARAALIAVFAFGAFIGAWSAGRFTLRAPSFSALGASFLGGALMGAGAALTPGGNDALVLIGVPLLQPSAFAAYASMTAAIALGFVVQRGLAR